jgi:L-ascorbate metabolism protein UlaG (beta-lactamase superfamily)
MQRITYVGHATLLLEVGGLRLMTDPILRQRILHLGRRNIPILDHWLHQLDAVLISHLHHDHLDYPSLRRLGPDVEIIVPRGAGILLQRSGFRHVTEIASGGQLRLGPLTLTAVHAEHSGLRRPLGAEAEAIGYLIDGESSEEGRGPLPCVYFAGDTDLYGDMADLAGMVDVGLIPVWGWGPTLGPGHMDPYRAAEAVKLIRPRIAIPIHWGTLFPMTVDLITTAFLTDPPQQFRTFVSNLAPQVEVRVLEPGQHWEF